MSISYCVVYPFSFMSMLIISSLHRKNLSSKPLLMVTVVEIRAHIDNLKKKVEVASKKATDQKRRLLKK